MKLTFASVCTGIGGMDLGLERNGMTPLWMCEIDQPCREVLRLHWPNVPIHHDMTALDVSKMEHPDILCGGTPCQGFSFAGLRQSLDDDRSNLCLHFVKLANELKPRIILWENVPGVLSSKDNAFGCFLGALVGANAPLVPPRSIGRWNKGKDGEFFSWTSAGMVIGPKRRAAWRVLDSQYFGVAQRRERVFVVCDTGDGSAEQILFEQDGVRRHSPPSREAREKTTYDVSPSLTGSGRGTRCAGESRGQDCVVPVQIANNTGAGYWTENTIAGCLRSTEAPTQPQTILGFDRTRGTVTGEQSTTLRACAMKDGQKDAGGGTQCVMIPQVTHPLTGEGHDAGEDGTGRGNPIVVSMRESGKGYWQEDEVAGCLRAEGENRPSRPSNVIAYRTSGNDGVRCQGDRTGALNCGTDANQNIIANQYAVRRLTPLECSRLQGFPDLWNSHAISERTGNQYEQKDSPRYKQYGNAVTVNVLEWLGKRIKKFVAAT